MRVQLAVHTSIPSQLSLYLPVRDDADYVLGAGADTRVECTFIAIGIVSILAVVTLRQDVAGAAGGDPGSMVAAGRSLVAVLDWTFLLGPGFVVGVGW